jgi:hypothetical protein
MARPLDVKGLLATGRQITESGRTQAVQLGTDLVEQGRQATNQISAVVDELVNRGGRNGSRSCARPYEAKCSSRSGFLPPRANKSPIASPPRSKTCEKLCGMKCNDR